MGNETDGRNNLFILTDYVDLSRAKPIYIAKRNAFSLNGNDSDLVLREKYSKEIILLHQGLYEIAFFDLDPEKTAEELALEKYFKIGIENFFIKSPEEEARFCWIDSDKNSIISLAPNKISLRKLEKAVSPDDLSNIKVHLKISIH